tara:strand:- start:38 stop:466 length:429 start_codon:yes stop_codon:yes gene_type:complete
LVLEPWQLLAAQSLPGNLAWPGISPGGPGVVAADLAAKIKFDRCCRPVLIRCKSTNKRKKMIYFKDLKKGQEIKSSQLHPFILCSGKLLESPKQGKGIKKTMLIDAKGSELGFFDEAGSVYSHQIKLAKVNGNWEKVIHAAS